MIKKRITIKDIAKAANCAPSMVSMAMNNKKGISKPLKAQILAIADQLNWKPTQASATLRSGISNKILLVLPYDGLNSTLDANGGVISLLDGLIKGVENTPYLIDIAIEKEAPELLYPRLYQERQPVAFVFMNTLLHDWRVKWLTQMRIPFVSFGQTELATPHHFVDFDNEHFAYEATHSILEQGIDQVFLFASDPHYTYSQALISGYKRAHRELGFTIDDKLIIKSASINQTHNPLKMIEHALSDLSLKNKGFVSQSNATTIALIKHLQLRQIDLEKEVSINAMTTDQVIEILAPYVTLWFQDLTLGGHRIATILQQILTPSDTSLAPLTGEVTERTFQHLYQPSRSIADIDLT